MDWQKLVFTIVEELDRVSEAKSCIMASVVLLDVLRAKGIKDAYPLTVKYKFLNPKATERLKNDFFRKLQSSRQSGTQMAARLSQLPIKTLRRTGLVTLFA